MYVCGVNEFQESSPRGRRFVSEAVRLNSKLLLHFILVFHFREAARFLRCCGSFGCRSPAMSAFFDMTDIVVAVASHFDTSAEAGNKPVLLLSSLFMRSCRGARPPESGLLG